MATVFLAQDLKHSRLTISYHVDQIVYLAHATCGSQWKYLSIPPGASDAYHAQPSLEKPSAHAQSIGGGAGLPREKSETHEGLT
jgi:Protein of unknown function (DUF1572)